jgi:hypothetical protein
LPRLWLYRPLPGGHAQRSIHSLASTVHRVSWRAFRAAMADLRPEDRRLFSEALVPQPARPSVMNQRKLHSRRARGSTATPSQRRMVLAAYKYTQFPCMIVPRPLRANYVRSRFLVTPAGARLIKAAIAPSLWDCRHCPFKFPCDIEAMKTVRRLMSPAPPPSNTAASVGRPLSAAHRARLASPNLDAITGMISDGKEAASA